MITYTVTGYYADTSKLIHQHVSANSADDAVQRTVTAAISGGALIDNVVITSVYMAKVTAITHENKCTYAKDWPGVVALNTTTKPYHFVGNMSDASFSNLAKQKIALADAMAKANTKDSSLLYGILTLMDEFQDHAVDSGQFTEDVVFPEEAAND